MALKITMREVGDVAVVALDGRLVFGDEAHALREQVKSMLATGQRKIVLDLAKVAHLDSAGLATLAAARHAVAAEGGVLKLASVGPNFQELLRAVGLLTAFEIYDSEAAALASF